MAAFSRTDEDVLGFARVGNEAAVQLFAIREGTTIGRDVFLLENLGDGPDEEALSAFIKQYYATAGSIPPRVLVPAPPARRGRARHVPRRRAAATKVSLAVPQRGEGRALMDLAGRNAGETLAREQARWLADEGKTLAALEELAEALGLAAPPLRIECYDISNIQGTNTVGSMVVFEEGRPRSGEYRRFRVRTASRAPTTSPATRRCCGGASARRSAAEEGSAEELRWRLPDLVVIDGGKGQVSAAREVLDALGLHDMPRGRPGQGARGAVPARPVRPDRAARHLAGALPGPAAPRRGAPLRHHLPPQAARAGADQVGLRRDARRRPGAQARAAARLRVGQAAPRRQPRRDRGRARHQPRPAPNASAMYLDA